MTNLTALKMSRENKEENNRQHCQINKPFAALRIKNYKINNTHSKHVCNMYFQ